MNELKQILIETKVRAEQKQNIEIANCTRKLQNETIAPYFAEIENKKNKAIAEEREKCNQEIMALNQAFEQRKKEYEATAEETKKKFSDRVISAETAKITAQYSSTIANLDKMIADLGE
jgi:ribosomal protein S17